MAGERVVIVGGGVSGLATAYFLGKLGIRSTIVEKSGRLGGLIRTDVIDGCQLEAGPDSYLAAKPAVTELAQELEDLKGQIIGSDDERRRIFVARDGKLLPMPQGMAMMVPGRWMPALRSELFSTKTKLRFVAEMFSMPRHRAQDASIREFVMDHFGREVLEYAADPLLAGVYGGNAECLSAESVLPRFVEYERKYGSLIRGVRRQSRAQAGSIFLSFQGGMQALTDALARAAAEWAEMVQAQVSRVERGETGWAVYTSAERMDADHVVIACPAHVAAELLEGTAASLAVELAAIPYSSAILVTLGYEQSRLEHPLNGFGFLVPTIERRTIAAATWVNAKFGCRARPGVAVWRAFVVDPEATQLLEAGEEEVIGLAREDFQRFLGIDLAPLFTAVQRWPKSMPQYVVGHGERQQRMREAIEEQPGLHLVGNAYQGVGVPDCVRIAKQTANEIRAQFGR